MSCLLEPKKWKKTGKKKVSICYSSVGSYDG
jgi:hypothetical protein